MLVIGDPVLAAAGGGGRALVAVVVLAGAWEWAGIRAARDAAAAPRLYALGIGIAALAAWRCSRPIRAGLAAFLRVAALWWLVALALDRVRTAARRALRGRPGWLRWCWCRPGSRWRASALVEPRGQLLLLFLIVLVAAADVGAYFGGRAFGRHKLAPRV